MLQAGLGYLSSKTWSQNKDKETVKMMHTYISQLKYLKKRHGDSVAHRQKATC